MNVAGRQQELISDLLIIEDVQERLSAVVARAAKRKLADEQRVDANLVKGCVSRVWLAHRLENGVCRFDSDADSPMVKGLVSLLCEVYDGGEPVDVIATEPELWSKLGFQKNLSPTRINGLSAVRARIKQAAEEMRSTS